MLMQSQDQQFSSGKCETMKSSKICNFDPKASESCQNFNISNVGYQFPPNSPIMQFDTTPTQSLEHAQKDQYTVRINQKGNHYLCFIFQITCHIDKSTIRQQSCTQPYQSFDGFTISIQSLLGQKNQHNFGVSLYVKVHVSQAFHLQSN